MFFENFTRTSIIVFGSFLFSISASAMNPQEANANKANNPSVNNRLWFVLGSPIIISNNTGSISINSGLGNSIRLTPHTDQTVSKKKD